MRNANGITELKGNQQHAETVKGPHKVFIDGKALPDAEGSSAADDVDEDAVIDALRREEVIN